MYLYIDSTHMDVLQQVLLEQGRHLGTLSWSVFLYIFIDNESPKLIRAASSLFNEYSTWSTRVPSTRKKLQKTKNAVEGKDISRR